MSARWYLYKKAGNHYFLTDFCYMVNVIVLLIIYPYSSND